MRVPSGAGGLDLHTWIVRFAGFSPISRLPEFLIGICIGYWLRRSRPTLSATRATGLELDRYRAPDKCLVGVGSSPALKSLARQRAAVPLVRAAHRRARPWIGPRGAAAVHPPLPASRRCQLCDLHPPGARTHLDDEATAHRGAAEAGVRAILCPDADRSLNRLSAVHRRTRTDLATRTHEIVGGTAEAQGPCAKTQTGLEVHNCACFARKVPKCASKDPHNGDFNRVLQLTGADLLRNCDGRRLANTVLAL